MSLQPVTVTDLNQRTTAVLRRVKAGESLPVTERGVVVAYLTPPPPTATGNPTVDRWISEGRIVPAAVPGSIVDLPPATEPPTGQPSLADEVLAERERDVASG